LAGKRDRGGTKQKRLGTRGKGEKVKQKRTNQGNRKSKLGTRGRKWGESRKKVKTTQGFVRSGKIYTYSRGS